MKNRGLDNAICPGCGAVYTRNKLADGLKGKLTGVKHVRNLRIPLLSYFVCPSCGYEHDSPPFRPLTVQEILDGKQAANYYNDVNLEKYAISLLEIYYGSHRCNCGDLAEYEHLRDRRRKSKRDLARLAELEKKLERIYGPQTEEEKDREKDLEWIAERLKITAGMGRRPTGIRDNNGRMICEGDLVAWRSTVGADVRHRVTYSNDRACFMHGNISFDRLLDRGLNPIEFEVIEP
jgi:hypothetical protein